MFSSTIKRSVATLGVVAGLLAAAVPASAGTRNITTGIYGLTADPSSEVDNTIRRSIDSGPGDDNVKGPNHLESALPVTADAGSGDDKLRADSGQSARSNAPFTLDVATSEVFELNTFGLTEHEGAAFRGEVNGLEP